MPIKTDSDTVELQVHLDKNLHKLFKERARKEGLNVKKSVELALILFIKA